MNSTGKRYLVAAVGGVIAAVVALQIINGFGGAPEIQVAESPQEFGELAAEFGNPVRWSNGFDMFMFVPAFLLALVSAARGLSRALVGVVQKLGVVALATSSLWALADTTENIITFVGLGTVDLDAADAATAVQPGEGLIDALNTATTVKVAFLFVSLGLVVVLALLRIVTWINSRRGSSPAQ